MCHDIQRRDSRSDFCRLMEETYIHIFITHINQNIIRATVCENWVNI